MIVNDSIISEKSMGLSYRRAYEVIIYSNGKNHGVCSQVTEVEISTGRERNTNPVSNMLDRVVSGNVTETCDIFAVTCLLTRETNRPDLPFGQRKHRLHLNLHFFFYHFL